jgi:uncharacterized protein (TIGR02246 family)
MKILITAVSLLALLGTASAKPKEGKGHDAKDEDAVKETVAAFVAAFNKGDAKAVAALFTDEGSIVNVFGMEMAGKAVIEKELTTQFAGPLKGVTNTVTPTKIVTVAPNFAVGDADLEIAGMKTPDGKALPAIKARGTGVFVKQKGKWLFAAARGYVHVPPPGAPPAGTVKK